MSEIEINQLMQDPYSRHLGMELVSSSDGKATTRMAIQDHHLNGMQRVHGGAVMSLADFAFAAACLSRGRPGVGVNVTIAYIKAARRGVLYAHAEEVSCGQRIANYTVRVVDQRNELIALMQGMAYRSIPRDVREAFAGE